MKGIDMSHEVESMMYDKEQGDPWHLSETGDVCKVLTEEAKTNWQAALSLAGLDWTKRHVPTYFKLEDGGLVESPDTLAVVRESDNRFLGSVGTGTKEVQNSDALKWFDPFLASGLARFDTAGSLRGGRIVWAQAIIIGDNGSDIVSIKGDEVSKRILLSFSHDNTMGVHMGFTPTRVRCLNTLRMAESDEQSALLRIRKTANVLVNMDDAREIMNLANAAFEASAEQWRFLASVSFTDSDLDVYVRTVLDLPVDKECFDNLSTRTRNIVETIRGYASSAEDMKPELRGTYWAAYQAFTRYLTHDSGRNGSNRMASLWFGQAKSVNARALFAAMKMAKGEDVSNV
jgi:phage/plasmid-like protein (TIGR03299 family)